MQADDVSDDMSSETAHETLPDGGHQKAAAAFVNRARSQHEEELVALYVFGSTVRGEASGQSSDVDVLIVLDDDVDRETVAESLRDIALDVIIEYGPAVELHILSESTFDCYRQEGNPFVRNVLSEGRSYA
jgi:predicted nucleotidyltransferase